MGLNSITRKQLHLAILFKNYNYNYINYNYILFKTSSFFQLETQYHFCGGLSYRSRKPVPYPAHPQTVCQYFSISKWNFIF